MSWNADIRDYGDYLRLERSLSANSIEAYIHDIRLLSQFIGMQYPGIKAPGVTLQHVEEFLGYLHELGMSAHSQARILSGVKGFYKYLLFENIIEIDPTALIEAPRLGRKLPDTLSYPEIETLFDAIDLSSPEGGRNRAMLEVLYSSGLRVSELVNLTLHDLHFDTGFLRVLGKGNKERLVPIGSDARKYATIYIEQLRGCPPHKPAQKGSEAFVFLNRNGRKLTRVMVFTIIKTWRPTSASTRASARTPSATPSPHTSSKAAQTSGPYRKCSDTNPSPPPKSIPTSTATTCGR